MLRPLLALVPVVVLTLVTSGPAVGQEQPDYPRLRAALHELREARKSLKEATDTWPPGEKERAQRSLEAGIDTLRVILAVKDVENFRGVDRNPEYYRKYKGHVHLRAALEDVRDARDELRSARSDFGGQKDRAMDHLDVVAGCIVTLITDAK